MTYNVLLTGMLPRDRVAAVLAELFRQPLDEVDVAGADDYDDRNWDATVSCTYEPVHGDVSWALDVYVPDGHPVRPAESELAAALAEALGQPVLFAAAEHLPSAYWLAAPHGLLTRARLYESDDEDAGYTLDAVGRPVPGLPDVPVDRQPEVIREHRVATPVSDAFHAWTAERGKTANAAAGGEQTEAEWYARTRLGAWESLVTRMATGWPPDGWYPAAFYREDLELRDELTRTAAQLDGESATRFAEALTLVDDAFRTRTVEDRGAALAEATGLPRLELALRGWWWQRRPEPLPWPQPGA
ncbi:hypothetical protein ACFV1L_28875 [Kitasatospora sp. NPDC059646]|uniref:hypothetical protein n=1 Tax=Kitasatospora sp. NPDC059646 TaxID=3346893 RepID=UPI00367AE0DB